MDYFEISLEILKGMGQFFLQPLFYIFILFSLFTGYRRVKRERKDFHTRVYDVIDNVTKPLFPSLIAAVIVSLLMVGLGVTIPIGMIALFAVVQLLLLLTGQTRLLSPAYIGGITVIIALVIPSFETGMAWLDRWLLQIRETDLAPIVVLVAIFIILEGILIIKNGAVNTSPKLFKSKRGKIVGGHEAKKLWIVPTLILVPSGSIEVSQYWPLLFQEATTVGFLAIPFAVGYHQVVRSTLPVNAIANYGKRVLLVGMFILLLSIISFVYPLAIPVVAVIALFARELVAIDQKLREDRDINMYTPRENGLVVLGIIPGSPAEKMNIQIGEIVAKVNNICVKTDSEFYEALQKNSAFCKLEIINADGEPRFCQTALYDGEHYQVGILFVQQKNVYDKKAL